MPLRLKERSTPSFCDCHKRIPMKISKITTPCKIAIYIAVLPLFFISCSKKIDTSAAEDTKYIPEFHEMYFAPNVDVLKSDNLSLYVDNSTCIALGQNSAFYNELVPSFVDATKSYFSIKGNSIIQEHGDTYQLLKNVQEVNYADLKTAINKMASSDSESALLTDGEFYNPTIAGGNVNNPYMADALKKWLLRGHDVYFISEPYTESNNGTIYNKKRFYILFTDCRLKGNIYDRIMQTVKLENYPDVEQFHLSADHPSLAAQGTTSMPNENLSASVKGFGSYEIQDWSVDWDAIQSLIVNAVDPNTGNALPNGIPFLTGIKLDRNSFGGYHIDDVEADVYNINQYYNDFYSAKVNKMKIGKVNEETTSYPNFIKIDKKEFKSHGMISLDFDTENFDPTILDGTPYNYFRIDIRISSVSPMFDRYSSMFEFDDINKPGDKNESVAASVKQCLTNPDVRSLIFKTPIYSIYVKSNEFNN